MAKQRADENITEYHTRLKGLAEYCEFTDKNKEIKSQIIQSCVSQKLRRKALKESELTLEELLVEARALEISESHATEMEQDQSVNQVSKKTSRPPVLKSKQQSEKKSVCFK